MTAIDIEYCVPCGLLENAQETQEALLDEYGQDLDQVSLSPGHGGVFKVHVDGKLVFDKDDHPNGYDLEAIEDAVTAEVGTPAQ